MEQHKILRELHIMRYLSHPNIIKIKQIIPIIKNNELKLYLVFESWK